MDIEKLMTEYTTLEWELQAAREKLSSLENKLAAIKEQLDEAGVKSDVVFSHENCGGMVVGLKSDPVESMYLCLHCHRKGDIEVRYDHDFSGYATFIEASN